MVIHVTLETSSHSAIVGEAEIKADAVPRPGEVIHLAPFIDCQNCGDWGFVYDVYWKTVSGKLRPHVCCTQQTAQRVDKEYRRQELWYEGWRGTCISPIAD
ncbi:MAG: hypothetical protein KDA66_06895 [Planctomycetaceae bacterium]|nr:hypothetical protein [Planctomycetaceae bacterium]